jgi:hypothetical protein
MAEKTTSEVRARDVVAPVENITLDGVKHKLVFNNRMARIAEDVYERQYSRDIGYVEILEQVTKRKYAAIMAMMYAGMVAGGHEMEWSEFDATFKLDSVDGIYDAIMRGVTNALPKAGEGGETDP